MPAIELLYQASLRIAAPRVLVINAHAHPLLAGMQKKAESLELWQHFKPEFDAIQRMGLPVSPELPATEKIYDLILLLPAKNKQQTLNWMAKAMGLLCEGGTLMLACANSHGAKSYESALKKLAGTINSASKSKCRIISAKRTDALNRELQQEWLEAGRAKEIESLALVSQPGLFSWDRADIGSSLLLEQLPPLSGTGMDLCSGYGLLSKHILQHSPDIDTLHMVEADYMAVQCARTNTQKWQHAVQLHWADATHDKLPKQLDWIVCNPPFHTGQTRDVDLGQRIVKRACLSLKKGGILYLVANRKLPYEKILQAELHGCQTLIEGNGFKVLQGKR